MVPTSQLDKILGHAHDGDSSLLEQTFQRHPLIKSFFSPLISLVAWVLELFNPPPLESMNLVQRTGRVVLLTMTLVVASILFAMVGALGLYLMERGRELRDSPQFYHGLLILLVGTAVNVGCVFALLQIKKADTKLVPPPEKK
jgi:formate hydrogenlyase subunit 3/multisubunit Na+/H+ antiporter MnhD subunit